MPYNRTNALAYADQYWNIPCDDGLFWDANFAVHIDKVRAHNVMGVSWWKPAPIADGWMPELGLNPNGEEIAIFTRNGSATAADVILIHPWGGMADCAHYLTRCLSAGGFPIQEISVPKLVAHLQDPQKHPNTKTLCEKVDTAAGQRVIDVGLLKPGDMIGYFNIDPHGDYNGAKQYSHSTMFVGKTFGGKTVSTDGGITCHTIRRFPGRSGSNVEDRWWLHPPGTTLYTFIHITDDDIPPNPARAAAIAGWWKLDYSGRTEYYLVHKNGTAQYTKRAPAKGQVMMSGALGLGHWFLAPNGDVTFVWKSTGTVEIWTNGPSYKSTINGSIPGTLTKL